jgi:hypothetical protein
LIPLLRVVACIAILAIAILVVLSDLGVNITPLVAGASVFGLAISFGSQALVRDIVSGIFYLADDAFRVGEYIDCGKAKGTVQGFTLRSIKLRHQNGQLHTIPFGQLGQVTNFSRDWATVKFNLRFAPKTDLEKLRKTVKAIGRDMLGDPELKDDFLEPLKMQGVADITDNGLVVRFKFTVKPMNPSLVQRQAIKRMVTAFAANGIDFASATIPVQALRAVLDAPSAGATVAPTPVGNAEAPTRLRKSRELERARVCNLALDCRAHARKCRRRSAALCSVGLSGNMGLSRRVDHYSDCEHVREWHCALRRARGEQKRRSARVHLLNPPPM